MFNLTKFLLTLPLTLSLIAPPPGYQAVDTLSPQSSFALKSFVSLNTLSQKSVPAFEEKELEKQNPDWIQNYIEEIPVMGELTPWQRSRLQRKIAQTIFERSSSDERIEQAKQFVDVYKKEKKQEKIFILQTKVASLDEIRLKTLASLISEVLKHNHSRRKFLKKGISLFINAAMPTNFFTEVLTVTSKIQLDNVFEPTETDIFDDDEDDGKLTSIIRPVMKHSRNIDILNDLVEKMKSGENFDLKTEIPLLIQKFNTVPSFKKNSTEFQEKQEPQYHKQIEKYPKQLSDDEKQDELLQHQWFTDGGKGWETFPILKPTPFEIAL